MFGIMLIFRDKVVVRWGDDSLDYIGCEVEKRRIYLKSVLEIELGVLDVELDGESR